MDFLIVIGIVVFILMVMPKGEAVSAVSDKLVIEKKKCPPHQWDWQEIVDQHGNKQGERIICKVCGPLASQSGRD